MQNAVEPSDMGVATASPTFFRQMGSTAGTAIFLSLLFSTLSTKISSAFKASYQTAPFQQAIHDPAVQGLRTRGKGRHGAQCRSSGCPCRESRCRSARCGVIDPSEIRSSTGLITGWPREWWHSIEFATDFVAKLPAGFDAEFAEDFLQVVLDGVVSDEQPVGDFLVCVADGGHGCDLRFTWGER